MEFPIGDDTKITGYHAHIYYDEDSREKAARLREQIWNKYQHKVEMGRFRDRAVGPHPMPMYQVAFSKDLFPEIVPWLMYHRDGLTILVHPEAEDAFNDHAHYPLWMGQKLQLRLDWLARGNRSA
jgi:aromatic ring-cleaving dioxygenase